MKILGVLFCVIGVFYSVSAQEISKEFKTTQFNSANAVAANGQHIYLGYSENQLFNQLAQQQYVYKLDFNLNIVDSVNLSRDFLDSSGTYLHMLDIEVDDQGHIYSLCIVEGQAPQCFRSRSLIIKLDQYLRVLDTFHFESDSLQIALLNMNITGNTLVAAGSAFVCGVVFKPYVAKIDLMSGNVATKFYNGVPYRLALDFLSPAQFDGKIIAATNVALSSTQDGNLSTVVLDSNLEILHRGSVSDVRGSQVENRELHGPGAFIPISADSVWKLSASSSYPPAFPASGGPRYYTLGASLLDSSYHVTTIDTFSLSGHYYITPNSALYATLRASWDPYHYRVVDSVLYVQGEKFIGWDNYTSQDSTAFYIFNFNARSGTMNWVKRIQRNYTIGGHAVAALPGNRWAISFNEYNWDKYPGQNLSVHVWILNGQGDIISQKEIAGRQSQLEVYPNPSTDVIRVKGIMETHKTLTYQISDITGKVLQTGRLDSTDPSVDVRSLAPGTYLLIIEGAQGKEWAKFVKK